MGVVGRLCVTSLGLLGRRTEGEGRKEPIEGESPVKDFGDRGVDGGIFGL